MGGGNERTLALAGRTYLVLGATGNLGRPIMDLLLWQGANVIAVAKSKEKLIQTRNEIDYPMQRVTYLRIDIPGGFHHLLATISHLPHLYGIVYALGHCPPGGFSEEVKDPLLSLHCDRKTRRDYNLHVTMLSECINRLIDHLPDDCHFVVLGSAITDIPWDKIPPSLHAGHYAMATAAKEQYVKFLRLDPKISERHILVHYIAPGAVDTPFHHDAPPDLTPPCMLSTDDVANEVLLALLSKKPVHKLWRAQPK